MLCTPVVVLTFVLCTKSDIIIAPDGQLGRKFEGIGAISGGGATSKLLPNYDETRLREILDYLFKPNYAASLTQLKVEIGGDSQSTEGTEASHMHTEMDLDCGRGYESWLVKRAKEVNPGIEIHGLPWTFPGWLGRNPYQFPEKTADYITKWVICMNETFNVEVDYIGIWNERQYDVQYIKILRQTLDSAGYNNVKIIASDGKWQIIKAVQTDSDLRKAIYAIGAHYPGTNSNDAAKSLNMPLWASEDYSTFNDDVGSGCWARILNQNYVNGLMTSTIAWNLIASYVDKLPYAKCSLMTANEPWSGHYTVNGPIWVTAHTTQFTKPGWYYLGHGTGVGHLPEGGSYVSLVSPDRNDLTIIVETMSHDHSVCIRPSLPHYTVIPQNVTFMITGEKFSGNESLHVYRTKLEFVGEKKSEYFNYAGEIEIVNNRFTLPLDIDELYTLSTIKAVENSYPKPPPSTPFVLPYVDNFQVRNNEKVREPEYLTPQVGYFELIRDPQQLATGITILQQMPLVQPIDWCNVGKNPIAVMGYSNDWVNMMVKSTIMMPSENKTHSIFIAARVQHGGCNFPATAGIFAWLDFLKGQYRLTSDLTGSSWLASGPVKLLMDRWYTLELKVEGLKATMFLNNEELDEVDGIPVIRPGFVALGCEGFGNARYANFAVDRLPA
ncbi:hypothetical protein CRM22_008389 [Opisthorchis felineus]|uniref:galactosylceramidase n=1 Tax=Opisthorchis felineus TaxID=147828 RepID=A0A4S2LBE9_OPIFE|nr:hypothetical protein CRM22_008389 [Opisthorchis felineus]